MSVIIMNKFLTTLRIFGLLFTILPSFILFGGVISHQMTAESMTAGMICWFLGAGFRARAKG